MDQKSYLAQALWHYRSTDKFTDIEIVCKDGTLSAHVALLAPFFASLGLKFFSSIFRVEWISQTHKTIVIIITATKTSYETAQSAP